MVNGQQQLQFNQPTKNHFFQLPQDVNNLIYKKYPKNYRTARNDKSLVAHINFNCKSCISFLYKLFSDLIRKLLCCASLPHFVIPDALCNGNMSHFVLPDTLFNNSMSSNFVIPDAPFNNSMLHFLKKSLPHFVILETLCNKLLSHFIITF